MGHTSIVTVSLNKSVGISVEVSWDWECPTLRISIMGLSIIIELRKVNDGGWFRFYNEYKDQ